MNDEDLKDLFADYRPQMTDGDEFMRTIEKKLEAVEYVKRYNAVSRRRSRLALAAAFVLGGALGCLTMTMFGSLPHIDIHNPLVYIWDGGSVLTAPEIFNVVKYNAPWIYMLAFAGIVSTGLIHLILSWQDVKLPLKKNSQTR